MDYLDQWNEDQRRLVAEWKSKYQTLRHGLAQIAIRASSRGGELGVTVDAQGNVTDLRLTPQALRLGDAQLGRVLLETIQRAQSEAHQRAEATARSYTENPESAAAMKFIQNLLDPDNAPTTDRP
ncbi:YbaB/EbfC family nucleoid-associated protein [Nocardia sp. NBC_01730]|uniref:YbaB/EbfC family nucleoid-associated protein n=1 Tax=Nocardia sp. NBC_01730 TaxID=2975998 RepID=UPI002E1351B4|nr:YbaB/EbfC family nucleoid-associated protein [Nocardia sp. NBC_01730]